MKALRADGATVPEIMRRTKLSKASIYRALGALRACHGRGELTMPKKVEVTTNEARQATTRPRAMIWVLLGSLFLCAMAGLGLARDGSVFQMLSQ